MKILFVQDYLRSGGTERQTLFLARALRQVGHEASVLTFRPGGTLAAGNEDLLRPPLQQFDLGLDWFAPGLSNRVALARPDVVMTMGRMANCYGEILQRRLDATPVIATVRTGKPLPWLYRRSLRAVAHVVANSQETADKIRQEHRLAPERVAVIHNSIVFDLSHSGPGPLHEAGVRVDAGAGLDTVVLLCVGMFRREKNQRDLLAAAARLPKTLDWQLWLVGEGEQKHACEQLASQWDLADRVRFFGFQARPQAFYKAADLAVLTSARESLSNFLIEAQANGLPAVAFEAQGVRECLAPGETGLVIPFGDIHSFASSCEALIRDKARRLQWGTAARERARLAFAPERQVAAYVTLFEHAITQRKKVGK